MLVQCECNVTCVLIYRNLEIKTTGVTVKWQMCKITELSWIMI